MDQVSAPAPLAPADEPCRPLFALASKPWSRSLLLLLPAEVRLMIYYHLFSKRRVTIHRPAEPSHEELCAIIRTCRLCYVEALPIFYESVTVTLKHEAFLYVLKKRAGQHNMARIRSLFVGGFDNADASSLASRMPDSLEKLDIGWTGATNHINYRLPWRDPASHIGYHLDATQRHFLTSCAKLLWTRFPRLRMRMFGVVPFRTPDQVCGWLLQPSAG